MQDNTLITGKKYIKDIFSREQFYNVPEYQRPYVWGEEQILALLNDINKAMESDIHKEYFLGCMIWNTRRDKTNDLEYYYQDILDGQQRFISLFLIHAVIRDLSADDNLKKDVQKKLVQEEDRFNNIPARNRIEFQIRDDKKFLHEFVIKPEGTLNDVELEKIINDPKEGDSIRNMASGIKVIKKWWKIKLTERPDSSNNVIEQFYTYLSNKVLALYLATPDNLDDAYNLFTVLNSRGMQLQVSDILRAQNLREIDGDVARKSYAIKWGEFENAIGAPYNRFDEFLWALVFIKMKYRSDDNKSLTIAFDFMGKRGMLTKGSETFDFVGRYIAHYEAIGNRSITSKDSHQLFGNINFILASVYGNQYLTPLMHYRECFDENRILDFMIKIDNLFSMQWLMGRRQGMTRTFLILKRMDLLVEKVHSREKNYDEAIEELLNDPCLSYDFYDETISAERPIDPNEFYQLLGNEKWGSFGGTKVNKTRYLLLKLDMLMGSPNSVLQYNKDSSSIEHLMPQNVESSNWEIDGELHREWVHRLGNLVLIDKNKNASISNRLFSEKKVRYQGAIEARANTNFVFMNNPEWSMEALKNNHTRVVYLLIRYYKGNSLKSYLDLRKELNSGIQSFF